MPTNKCGVPGFNNSEDTFAKSLLFTLAVVWIYVSIGLLSETWLKLLRALRSPSST
jgi:hypothetical protein